MKKTTYQKPATQVVRLHTANLLLAASRVQSLGAGTTDDFTLDSDGFESSDELR